MFKSIFTKYLSAFALIICISFLMLSSIIATIVSGYATDVRVQDISWALQVSKSSMKLLYENCDEESFLEAIKQVGGSGRHDLRRDNDLPLEIHGQAYRRRLEHL